MLQGFCTGLPTFYVRVLAESKLWVLVESSRPNYLEDHGT